MVHYEIQADHVEATLLGQVYVAKIGQEINVWVLWRTRIRLRVGAFPSICHGHCGKLTHLYFAVFLHPHSKTNVLLPTTKTEVHIAFKLCTSASTASTKAQLANSKQDAAPAVCSTILRVLPASLCQIGISVDNSTHTRPESLTFTSRATFKFEAVASFTPSGTHAFKGTVVEEGDSIHRTTLRLLNGPLDPCSSCWMGRRACGISSGAFPLSFFRL